MGGLLVVPGGAPSRGPLYREDLAEAPFAGVAVERWMWCADGLALRPGVDLMVYAVVYAASAGGGLLACSAHELARELGCARETVTRSLGRLASDCLVWSPAEAKSHAGGRPVRCWRCCEGPLRTAGVPARALARLGEAGGPTPCRQRDEGAQDPPQGFRQAAGDAHETRGLGDGGARSQRDGTSRPQGGTTSPKPPAHVGEIGPSPAQTRVFDTDHISTYTLQETSEVTSPVSGGAPAPDGGGDGGPRPVAVPPEVGDLVAQGEDPLLEADLLAFTELVASSLLPVDDAYLAQALIAFKRLVEAGVPADAILSAYGQYAAYWRDRRRRDGEFRPMHLLNWLRQRPNEQIRHVVAERDERWRRARQASGRRGRSRPTHESPRIERCLDRDKPIYFVTDERGGRIIRGSRGVERPTLVMGLYEHMYALETLEARGRGA